MHTVIRAYGGAGVSELFDRIQSRAEEVEPLMRAVPGFVNWSSVRTADGGAFTITVCQDKAGTDASSQVARDWVAANAADLEVDSPQTYEGDVAMHFG